MRAEIKESIDRYAKRHCPTGGFLRAVLENDLMEAIGRADDGNREDLFEICSYIYNHIPSASRGSPKRVRDWIKDKEVHDAS